MPALCSVPQRILPKLKERYIAPGKVRLIYAISRSTRPRAALWRIAPPERYFSMLEVLFETQANWARADDPIAALKQLGKLGGLTDQAMAACLADEKLTNGILQGVSRGEPIQDRLDPDLHHRRQGLFRLA